MKLDSAIKKLQKFFTSHKRLPSYSEMCSLFGFASKKASFTLAKKLIKMGVVEKDDTGRLIPKQLFPQIKLLGSIAAGIPTPAEEQLLSNMSFDHFLVNRPERSYLLKVKGDSMVEAGIHDGDLVVIEKGVIPSEEDIVVAEVDGEFTLKYLKKKEGQYYLMPANSNYSPIYPRDNLTIFGIVISVIRKYH